MLTEAMAFERWELYIASLYVAFEGHPPGERRDFFRDYGRFREFVDETPQAERIPLLLFAYERYRGSLYPDPSDWQEGFWQSAYAILISDLLAAKLKPTEEEACRILRNAWHFYGNGQDALPPLELAEKAFRHRPYSAELFAAAGEYREMLRVLRSAAAGRARARVDLLLWHDVRNPARGCWSSGIQRAIAAMDAEEAFAWQWLLRNTARGLRNAGRGKTWSDEAKRRLAELGQERFLRRLDEWLVFSDEERLQLGKPGSQMLCLLVLYAGLAGGTKSLPILARLSGVKWSQRERMQRVVEGLERIGRREPPDAS